MSVGERRSFDGAIAGTVMRPLLIPVWACLIAVSLSLKQYRVGQTHPAKVANSRICAGCRGNGNAVRRPRRTPSRVPRFVFGKALEGLFIDRMQRNEKLFARFMNDKDFQRIVTEHLLRQVYAEIRDEESESAA